jgi:hypothetical protein
MVHPGLFLSLEFFRSLDKNSLGEPRLLSKSQEFSHALKLSPQE